MRLKKYIYILSLIGVIHITSNIDVTPVVGWERHKLSPVSFLHNNTNSQKSFSQKENIKIENIKALLSKHEHNFDKFLAVFTKNNPKETQEALKRYLSDRKNQNNAAKFLNILFIEKNINPLLCKKVLIPFFNNIDLIEKNIDFFKNLQILLQKTLLSQKINQQLKNQMIKNIVVSAGTPSNIQETEIAVKNILDPIVETPEYAKTLTDTIFPKIYQSNNIHIKMQQLSQNIRQDILTYIISKKSTDIDLRKTILRILQETEDTEKENKIIDFLNKNYNQISGILKFFKQKDIKISQSFLDFIIRRRQTTLLKALNPSFDNQDYTQTLKNLMLVEYTKNKKHNTIKDNILNIYEIFSFDKGKTPVSKKTIELLNSAIDDFDKNIIGNKKFSEKIKTAQKEALYIPVINTIKEMISIENPDSDINTENKIINIMDSNPEIYSYLLNLCDIYNRTKRIFPATGKYIRQTIQKLMAFDGNLKKLNKWLYTEAPWNKEAYKTLISKGFSPSLWEKPLQQTYFANSQATLKMQKLVKQIKKLKTTKNLSQNKQNKLNFLLEELARIKKEEPKIIVELEFDFLKDSYSGIALHDSISPNKRFEIAPLSTALEANTVFMHVYKENSTTPFSSILLALTPSGLVDMGFPTDSPDLEQPVFDMISQLIKNETIPVVNINSKKTNYVSSATYNFAESKNLLKTAKKESIKKEPWNINTSLDPKNPRHYPVGKNVVIDGVQHGVFKTSFFLDKNSIKNYADSISIENIENEINIDEGKHLYSAFLDKLRQEVLINAKTQKDQKAYMQKILPSLSILKDYMQKHNLLPERLHTQRKHLVKILPSELMSIIDDKTQKNTFSLNMLFAKLSGKKQTHRLIPASA